MNFPVVASRTLLRGALTAAVAFTWCGCSLPVPRHMKDRAFIHYNPAPPESKALRLAVKDLIDLKGEVTSAGSRHFARWHPPATKDADCMEIARERNVHIVGKVNLSELALGVSGMNEFFGTPRSPLRNNRRLIPGGSSSGSAVAVATDMADVSFGTDTAGSVRVPAACCGVFGLKTTYGLVSLNGVTPISAKHLDTVGPLAKDVPRLVQGMGLLERGFEAKYRAAVAQSPSPRGIRVGRLHLKGTDPDIDRAVDDALRASGFRVVRMSEEFTKQWERAQSDGRSLAAADSWVTDSKYLKAPGVSLVTRAIIRWGQVEYLVNYRELLESRRRWKRQLTSAFDRVDFIALPTLQEPPPRIPWRGRSVTFEARVLTTQNTAAVNLAGNPALAVPVPIANEKIPYTSVQLVGPNRSEAKLINAGRILSAKAGYRPGGQETSQRSAGTARKVE